MSIPHVGASAFQPGTAFTSITYNSPRGPGSRSTPAIGQPTAVRGAHGQFCFARDQFGALGRAALGDVGAPVVAPDDRRIAARTFPPITNTRRSWPGCAMNRC